MVIVILGILSAFALPRFADLSGSAETAALEGARASVASASAIVHAAALVANESAATGNVAIEGGRADLVFGYPAAVAAVNFGIKELAQIGDFELTAGAAPATPIGGRDAFIYTTAASEADCFVFTEASRASATDPIVAATVSAIGQLGLATEGTVTTGDTCAGITL